MTVVLCVGDVMLDVVVRGAAPPPGGDAPATIALRGGGSAANTAAWLAAAGQPAAFAGRVGDDDAGARLCAELEAQGVELRVEVVPGGRTGTCVVLLDDAGERTMRSDRGVNGVPAALGEAGWVHVSGYVDLPGDSVDPGPLGGTPRAPLVFASEGEPAGAGETFFKLGAGGARHGDLHVPAPAVQVVDTTGAGDAFAAGVLAARLRGEPVEAQLRAGVALAARCVQTPGARPQSAAGSGGGDGV